MLHISNVYSGMLMMLDSDYRTRRGCIKHDSGRMSKFVKFSRFMVICAVGLCVIACTTTESIKDSSAKVEPGTAAGTDTLYRLNVGDGLMVHFFSFPDLDEQATVGPDGRVSLRLINDFPIAGLTLTEATKELNDRYDAVLRHPGVSIEIKSYALQQIFVSGEVNSPGVIRSSIPLTAAGAIAQAGGVKLATAHAGGALLLRRKPDGTIVYYKLAFHGDLPGGEGDPILRTNDLIYIPRTPIAAVADFVQANLTRIIPVSVSYSVYHTF
jgi:protein involved in polysaccharide export with SLBB domain